MDDVTDVLDSPSSEPSESEPVLVRMEQFSADLQARSARIEEYVWPITTEAEAAEILLAMAAALKIAGRSLPRTERSDQATLKHYAQIYRRNVAQRKALDYLRTLDAADKLEIYGLVIEPAPYLKLAQ